MAESQPLTDPEEFQDPLENYDPKSYGDALEQALAEETVAAIQHRPAATVTPDTAIADAIQRLTEIHAACLLIEEDGRLVGVFSDRDVLDKVALEYDELKGKPVSRVMTTNPVHVYDSDSAAAALAVMAVSGFRHVPVTDSNKCVVGIVSPHRVTSFLRKKFRDQAGAPGDG